MNSDQTPPDGTLDAERARALIAEAIRYASTYRRVLLGFPGFALVVGLATGVLNPKYTSQSLIQPVSSEAQLSRLAGLAAQFGIPIPGGGTSNSVDFYSRLVFSRDILERVARAQYHNPATSESWSLTGSVMWRPGSQRDSLQAAQDWLEQHTDAEIDITAGTLAISVTAASDTIAEQINRRILYELDAFNVRTSQRIAAAEREFMSQRVAEAERELRASEDALKAFYSSNRSWQGSPDLVFEEGRLRRRTEFAQQVFTSLTQTLEQARIEEVRNTPVITVIAAPEGSARRQPLTARAFKFVALGLALGILFVLYIEILTAVAAPGSRLLDIPRSIGRRFGLLEN